MNEEFIEAHKDEIEQLGLISGRRFDDVVEMLNRAMAAIKDVFDKLVEAIKAVVDILSEFIPDRWKELHEALTAECKYDPPPKRPRPPKKSYMHYVAPVVSHNFRRVQHRR